MSIGSTSGRGILTLSGIEGERIIPFVGVAGVEWTSDCGGEVVPVEGAIVIMAARENAWV